MKKRQNSSQGATALRRRILAVLTSISIVLPAAASLQAAPAENGLHEPGSHGLQSNNALTSGSWTPTGSLSTGRYSHTATLLPNGKVLVAGGVLDNVVFSSAELYDPANGTWNVTGSLNTARTNHTATLLPNGRVLVAGGAGNGGGYVTSAELYDPSSGTWTLTGSLNTGRYDHTATLFPSGKVLVAGGFANVPLPIPEVYNPVNGTWTFTGSLNTARRALHASTLLTNGKALVVGGVNAGPLAPSLSSAELYDPATDSWTLTGGLNTGRYSHTATLLLGGQALVAGGTAVGFVALSSAELFDLASGTWMVTGSLNTARGYHTATLLPNGKVLVAGGYGSIGSGTFSSAELYDPASGNWTVTGSLNTARGRHTATLLHNGRVLVAGGDINGGNSAELYDTGLEICSVCHKYAATLTLECGSSEYRRHLDHGDTVGACPPSKKSSDQADLADSLGDD